jgi:hypothetical protein
MPTIFALECDDKHYYIGISKKQYFTEIDGHFRGISGVEWTSLHKPIKLVMLRPYCDASDHDMYVEIFMQRYGIDKVRGGSYIQTDLEDQMINVLKLRLNDKSLTCRKCVLNGHGENQCPFTCPFRSMDVEQPNYTDANVTHEINATNTVKSSMYDNSWSIINSVSKYVCNKCCGTGLIYSEGIHCRLFDNYYGND